MCVCVLFLSHFIFREAGEKTEEADLSSVELQPESSRGNMCDCRAGGAVGGDLMVWWPTDHYL